jgi:hypothetical protein
MTLTQEMTSSSPALHKDPSFKGSGCEHRSAKLLNAGNLKHGKQIISLETMKVSIR